MHRDQDSAVPSMWSIVSVLSIVVLCSTALFLYTTQVSRAQTTTISTYLYVSICGDGIVQTDEVCDDGLVNNVGGYGSSTAARHCNAGCQSFAPYCGDGVLQVRFTEQCDDGNSTSGDLCSSLCRTEAPLQPKSTGAPPVGSIPQNPAATPGTLPAETLTKVVLRGKAYPNSTVSILLDGKALSSVHADSNADFLFTTSDITPGTATFSFSAKDARGIDSLMSTVVFEVIQSAVTTVANIFLPPTVEVNTTHIAPGGFLTISGQSVPTAKVVVQIDTQASSTLISTVDGTGSWAFQLDTGSLAKGNHSTKAYFQLTNSIKSGFGRSISFVVGEGALSGAVSPDLNHDGKVNLVDFSIFLISWNTTNVEGDFNQDGKVNLADFSIMLFAWTG